MSECVVRMEMPESCLSCPFFNKVGCKASNRMFPDWMNVASRPWDCPIICQLPEGHGRLADAGSLFDEVYEYYGQDNESNENWMMEKINGAPTIVPADTGERSEKDGK